MIALVNALVPVRVLVPFNVGVFVMEGALVRTGTPPCCRFPRKLLLPKNVWFAVFVPAGQVVAAQDVSAAASIRIKVASILIVIVFLFTKLRLYSLWRQRLKSRPPNW